MSYQLVEFVKISSRDSIAVKYRKIYSLGIVRMAAESLLVCRLVTDMSVCLSSFSKGLLHSWGGS